MKSPYINKAASPAPEKNDGGAATRLASGILGSVISFWILCSKQATVASRKLATNSSPKKMMSTISHKAVQFRQKKRVGDGDTTKNGGGDTAKNGGGEGGSVWQKTILMGDKCQPLDFSGVIYYDSDGKRLSEVPMRSPRASPLPSYAYKSEKERSRLGW